ncbi:hypothetical protein PHYSODRAFT_321280 [Phytophthora sojae]|uniref:V-SNARE coiled-coil homology domain-containing protein n=1 Tax=Phytophthora sojae (strain P6497) TaxID=1094619 RepID=G4YI90_PHYSP|nr:hypothetical protein PHYSODRAFT_321280 [Phytophthora sojae]EGZ27473.1 hypothetical protein PHYSODRAFT_321280 [Phytophthora sojae]|eukprot:XP_009514748.1 hypothetical protein PHYSODRAFT_321280 [Phytophthora sojae]
MAVQLRSGKTCMTPTVAQEVHRAQQRTKKITAKGTHDSAIIVETAHFYTTHIQALQQQQSDLASELQAAEDAYADLSKNYEQLNAIENASTCCLDGRFGLAPPNDPPAFLKKFVSTPASLRHIRAYNNVFAFTSMGASIGENVAVDNNYANGRQGVYTFRVQGGERYMRKQYYDSMAIVREIGKPDLSITITCNPDWPEIKAAMLQNQRGAERPDLVARAFKLKLEAIKDDIIRNEVFGKCLRSNNKTIEDFRGLPKLADFSDLHPADATTNRLIEAELSYDQAEMEALRDQADRLNDGQRNVYDKVVSAVQLENGDEKLFFLDGPGERHRQDGDRLNATKDALIQAQQRLAGRGEKLNYLGLKTEQMKKTSEDFYQTMKAFNEKNANKKWYEI